MSDETVYVCSEGRPWRKTRDGFERLRAPTVAEVSPDRVVQIGEHTFIKAPPGSKRKPYDDKNGF
jgi:hypothetical protein